MTTLFKITYTWKKRSQSLPFSEEDYVDVTPLFLALEHFLSVYEGKFVLQIGDLTLYFDLRPDLSTIFDQILDVLESLTPDTKSPVELHFYEQGTDLILLLERQGAVITIQFVKGLSLGKQFVGLPDTNFSVLANVFLEEWIRFIQAVLDTLIVLQPDLIKDDSYRDYLNRLTHLNSGG